ncbi:MAG: ribosome small subunit-dependent GTPase A [Acidobacteriia bacterium]|nr:ribosome small subunit-dependent GTPase A [Terriglobia bacterium]
MNELSDLGFGPFFERQLQTLKGREEIPARVAAEHRGGYEVWSEAGSGTGRLAGRLRLDDGESGAPGVGDWVVLDKAPAPVHTAVIERVLARRTVFTRAAAGRQAVAQAIAANVDLVFVVCGLDADFNPRRIERYVARIWASGAQPAVILSKSDLCESASARLDEVVCRVPGVEVHLTSALRSDGVAAVRARIGRGATAAFVGSSGAGKSTLVNALLGEERMATGAVRARDGRGRHVTTRRQLILLPGGGLVLDTPGMRELALVDDDGLDALFGDVAELASRCRFRDCRHDTEPGCAVKAAVAAGELDADRLEHVRQLQREAAAFELRHDERARRQKERAWGQLSDEVAQLRRWKGGKE